MLLTEDVIIVRTISSICHRVFRIKSICTVLIRIKVAEWSVFEQLLRSSPQILIFSTYSSSLVAYSLICLEDFFVYVQKLMLRNIFQIFLQFYFSHKSVKSQHWITDIQIILNQHWQNCLFWVRIDYVINFHCKLIIIERKTLSSL